MWKFLYLDCWGGFLSIYTCAKTYQTYIKIIPLKWVQFIIYKVNLKNVIKIFNKALMERLLIRAQEKIKWLSVGKYPHQPRTVYSVVGYSVLSMASMCQRSMTFNSS